MTETNTAPAIETPVRAAVTLDKTTRRELILAVFESRKERFTHPEGESDKQRRWYPSKRENADGDGSCCRSPSAAWPWSYMLHCRTRKHVTVLVDRACAGLDVPPDVTAALDRVLNPVA